MKLNSLMAFVVLLALGILASSAVEGASKVKVNPGKCPVVTGQCMMLNPPNKCLNDSHCLNGLKCCKGMCGNVCVKPV
uniref:Secretory leukocyte peptidase inhibitor n=1 Tax=Molossus molossus TaxID=27622 RepID=A0A7J8HJR1_MOLMO|nr:secretory leukocyte peptidase inhibitor [Molossus molossus]